MKKFFTTLSPYSIQGQQLCNLLILFIVGKLFLDVRVTWSVVVIVVAMALLTEHILLYVRDGRITFLSLSAVLSALGLVFMVHADSLMIYAVVLSIALLQKYIYRPFGYHVFNPSNLAVSLALFLFPHRTYVEMWQWGHHVWLGTILFVLGLAILWRVRRLWIPVLFLVLYVSLQYFFIVVLQSSSLDFLWLRVFSGGFLIYSIFMLTDPRTTPETTRYQAVFIAGVAILATAYDYIFGITTAHLFWALLAMTTLVPIIRIISGTHTTKNTPKKELRRIAITSGILFLIVHGAVICYAMFV